MTSLRRSCLVTIWLFLISTTGMFILLTLGSARYGGVDGLYQRIRVEMLTRLNTHRPANPFVPTPLQAETVNVAQFAEQLLSVDAANSTDSADEAPAPSAVTVTQAETGVTVQPVLSAVELSGYRHMWQTWNNCGPATLAMNLSYFNHNLEQAQVAGVLKPNPDDKNVSPDEMVAFTRSRGLQARYLINGSLDRLRLLLSNGIPVLIETWLEPEPDDGMGHYRLLVGYDDAAQTWIAADSFVSTGVRSDQPYRGIRIPYADMEPLWAVFNRAYVVVYPEAQAPLVQAIVGPDMSQSSMWQNALTRFHVEIQTQPDDPFIWFNLGTVLVAMGQYEQAATAYDQARTLGLPWRMLWYQFGPFQAYYQSGRYQEVIALADATIEAGGEIEEIYYWKGRALAALNDVPRARQTWETALTLNPSYSEAAVALANVKGE